MAFSLGSLFVTIFDVSYGAKWLKKIKYNNLFINFFFITYVLVCVVILNIFQFFSGFDDKQYALFQSTTIFSVLGAYLLIFALQKRQTMYENVLERKVCYNLDIITYAFNFCVIPILYYWNVSYLNLSYLAGSLFCYILYTLFFYYVYPKKKSL
jgi:putative Mn2+ efflux pump MntP